MSQQCILIVEDEAMIAEAIVAYLRRDGYRISVARDGKQALELFGTEQPDMVILDLMLPFVSGEEICRFIRNQSRVPIIMLTAKAGEDDKIEGLNMGADDYIAKPFSPRELVARVNSLFRRCNGVSPLFRTISWGGGDLEADFEAHSVKKQGLPVNLTQSEFKLFSALAKRPNKTFTRDELIELVFGADFDGYDRTIDTHIKNLRGKIETDTSNPIYILTVRGVGYRFGGALT